MFRSKISVKFNLGFTLIELSIVLVVIGLIVGGILVGQDLIKAAEVRAQISQVEKFNTAARTFQGKYGYLPGDIPEPSASNFGFFLRNSPQFPGEGDGNGLIEIWSGSWGYIGTGQGTGETAFFWCDLSKAAFIENNFVNAPMHSGAPFTVTVNSIGLYLPRAKIGNGQYMYAYSSNGKNYYGLSKVTGLSGFEDMASSPTLAVNQSYNIDKKVDDGLPQSGNILAMYVDAALDVSHPVWAGASGTSATSGSAATCYDNGNVSNATQKYSTSQNGGNGTNCALSFLFQ